MSKSGTHCRRPHPHVSMRYLLVIVCTALTAVVFATGGTPPLPDAGAGAAAEEQAQPSGMVRTGKMLGPLSPDEVNYKAVTVPEPVWASVMAACAVIILRRGRQ